MELDALESMETDNGDDQRIEDLEVLVYQGRKWEMMFERFDKWLRQVPVIGFDSGRFDIPHLRLFRRFILHSPFVGKKSERERNHANQKREHLHGGYDGTNFVVGHQ